MFYIHIGFTYYQKEIVLTKFKVEQPTDQIVELLAK